MREAREQELALLGIHPVRYRSRGNNVFYYDVPLGVKPPRAIC